MMMTMKNRDKKRTIFFLFWFILDSLVKFSSTTKKKNEMKFTIKSLVEYIKTFNARASCTSLYSTKKSF